FTPPPVLRWIRSASVSDLQNVASGENPPDGATVSYYLKEKAKKLTLEVVNDKNQRIVRVEEKEKKTAKDDDEDEDEKTDPIKIEIPGDKGINRVTWDLRHQGGELIPKAKFDAGGVRAGPLAAPGTYTVRIIADGKTYSAKVEVRMDPRVTD